jgi:hypothetical protein
MDRLAHVVPMGLEVDRVIGGFKQYPTNTAVLVKGPDSRSKVERIVEKNIEQIIKMVSHTINVEVVSVDIHDFEKAFVAMRQIYGQKKDEGFLVYVNLSTGTRIVSSAALIAAFLDGATPYYVTPDEYNLPEGQRVLSTGVKDVVRIPTLGVLEPSRFECTVLSALDEKGGGVDRENELFDVLGKKRFFSKKKEGEDRRSYDARRRAKLNRTIKGLEDKGFVTTSKRGRSHAVQLTESGRLFSSEIIV